MIIYLTKEDAQVYMREKETKNLIFQMSFAFRPSKSFNTKVELKFFDQVGEMRIKKKTEKVDQNDPKS